MKPLVFYVEIRTHDLSNISLLDQVYHFCGFTLYYKYQNNSWEKVVCSSFLFLSFFLWSLLRLSVEGVPKTEGRNVSTADDRSLIRSAQTSIGSDRISQTDFGFNIAYLFMDNTIWIVNKLGYSQPLFALFSSFLYGLFNTVDRK